jgi:hypothetical protein
MKLRNVEFLRRCQRGELAFVTDWERTSEELIRGVQYEGKDHNCLVHCLFPACRTISDKWEALQKYMLLLLSARSIGETGDY